MSICPAFPVYLCNKRVAVTCWAMIWLSLSLLKAISTNGSNDGRGSHFLKYTCLASVFLSTDIRFPAYSIELCNSNCRKVPLIRNRWLKNIDCSTSLYYLFHLYLSWFMIHFLFTCLQQQFCLEEGEKSVVVFQKCTSGYTCTMKINGSYAKESCILMVQLTLT